MVIRELLIPGRYYGMKMKKKRSAFSFPFFSTLCISICFYGVMAHTFKVQSWYFYACIALFLPTDYVSPAEQSAIVGWEKKNTKKTLLYIE